MDQLAATIAVGKEEITVYRAPEVSESMPIVYLNAGDDEGAVVWEACRALGCPAFTLAVISGLQWNNDLTPWPMPPIWKNDAPYTGGADEHLVLLTGEIIPAVENTLAEKPLYRVLAGYSLAGLFAVYAAYHTNAFARIVSASGSLWYPDFLEYTQSHALCRVPDKMYFSLGDREAKTKNRYLCLVEERTRMLCEKYSDQGIPTKFELNPGNHFMDADGRMARGIRWILEPVKIW